MPSDVTAVPGPALSSSPPGAASRPMAEMLLAARQLIDAWDRSLGGRTPPASSPPWPGDGSAAAFGALERSLLPPHPAAAQGGWSAPACAPQALGLSARLLDGLQVWIGPAPMRGLPQGKARSLLRLLLLQRRRPLSRARLSALLWPDADAAGARNSLNVTIHRLRRVLGQPGLLCCTDHGYQLVVAGEVWLDSEQFQLQAEMGRLEELQGHARTAIGHYESALALYATDLLDEGEQEPALSAESQALRDRLNEVLERLAALYEAGADWHACLRVTLRHLGQDGCNEAAHRRLMRCYARLDQPQLAERQYRTCGAALRAQFGIGPSEQTIQLYRQITARLVN